MPQDYLPEDVTSVAIMNANAKIPGHSTLKRHKRRLRNREGYLRDRVSRIVGKTPETDITYEWLMEELDKQKHCCAVSGIPFDYSSPLKITPFSLSFDRFDSSKPYMRDNVQLVCYLYNIAKNMFTHQDVVVFANNLVLVENGVP